MAYKRRLPATLCLLVLISSGTVHGQAPANAAQITETYNKAMGAFASGDFAGAVANLEQMLAQGAEGPGVESVHYSLAAAHFNAQNPAKARPAFENYLKLYPNGAKAVDALLGIAQCQTLLGEKEKAAATFELVVQKGGPQKDQAQLAKAALLKDLGKPAEASTALQALVAGGLRSPESIQGAILLGAVEAERGERTKALNILEQLHGRFLHLVENPLQLNSLAFEIGDAFLHANDLKQALRVYSMVRSKEDTILLQQQRIQGLVRRMENNVAAAKNDPSRVLELTNANNRLRALVDAAKQALDQAKDAQDILFALRARQAAAYQETGRIDEAILLFESILISPDKTGREDTFLSLASLHAKNGNSADAVRVLKQLTTEFPKSKSIDTAQLLLGTQHLQLENFDEAAKAFSALLTQAPKSRHAPTALFLLANTHFNQAEYKKAGEGYQSYLKSFPSGEFKEEAGYRAALAQFFSGDYAPALESFELYVKQHEDGLFAPDAAYRIAACYQAARRFEDVVKRCTLWEAKYGDHPVSGDVLSLHGDALSALNRHNEALTLYRKASVEGASDEVVQYALFEANKLLQKSGRTEDANQMFREFLASKPQHPANVLAMYWIAKGTSRAGRTEEAKEYLAEKIAGFIDDRSKDAVEQLVSQLAQLCSKPPKSADGLAAPQNAGAYNPEESLAKHLDPKSLPASSLVQARILYARAELARFTRKPTAQAAALDSICDTIPPQNLGAALLAQSADRLLERKETKRALEFYKELMRSFPKSDLLDYAYNGQGQIALQNEKPEDALRWFTDAVDKAGASTKLREVTLGRAKALLMQGNPDEARPILEQVASTREWRGECTAEAVFLLGEVFEKKGDLAAALQYFQRVFVAYQRYERFVGRAYLKAAECFEKLGEPEKALAHYKELATKPRLASLPEVQVAKKRLIAKEPQ